MQKRTKAIIIITLLVLIIQTFTLSTLAANNADLKEKKGKGEGKGVTNTIESMVW